MKQLTLAVRVTLAFLFGAPGVLAEPAPRVIFEDSARDLPQAEIRAAIEQELGPSPSEGEEAPRLSIAVGADQRMSLRFEAGPVTRERTVAPPARAADVPVVLALIAGNLAREQVAAQRPAPTASAQPARPSPALGDASYPNEASTLHGARFARFSGRAELGGGWGTAFGWTMGLQAAFEYWLGPTIGVGILAGGMVQVDGVFGPGTSTWYAGPELVLRSSPTGYGPFVGVSAGLGSQSYSVPDSSARGCIICPDIRTYSVAGVGQLSLGFIAPIGHLQIGPVAEIAAVIARKNEAQLTLNLALGWAG